MLNLKTLNIVIIINIDKKRMKGEKSKNWELPLKSCHLNVSTTFGVKYIENACS